MIPHILHIKNFLSYGPETQIIDFRPFNLISLSGKNGHGKSALLDAITWAIWGQARKSSGLSKPDSGLMHLGQKHMMVILEFEVQGIIYRVRREYLNTQSKPFATLDFGVQNEDGKITPLTDKTIKDTQEKIERTIGITYESFANSTFLRQGQSNEFSKKSPKERKEILAQILQLQRFENQKKIALAHSRKLHQEHQTMVHIEQRITQELTDLANTDIEFQEIQTKIIVLQKKLTEVSQQYSSNLDQQTIVGAQLQEATFLQKKYLESTSKYQNLLKEIEQIKKNFTENHNTLSAQQLEQEEQLLNNKLKILEQQQQEKLQAREAYLTQKEQFSAFIQQLHEKHSLETQKKSFIISEYTLAKQQLERQKKIILDLIQQLEQQHNKALLQNKQYLELLKSTMQASKQYQEQKQKHDQQRLEYQKICSQGTFIKQYIQKIEEQITSIQKQDHAQCFECEQHLTEIQKNTVLQKLNTEHVQLQEELTLLKKAAQEHKTMLTESNTLLEGLEQQHEQYLQIAATQEQHQIAIKKLEDQTIEQQQQYNNALQDLEKTTQALDVYQKELQKTEHEYQQRLQSAEVQNYKNQIIDLETKSQVNAQQLQEYQETQQKLIKIREHRTQISSSNNVAEHQATMYQLLKQTTELEELITQQASQIAQYITVPQKLQELKEQEQLLIHAKQQLDQALQKALIEQGTLQQKQIKQAQLRKELEASLIKSKLVQQDMFDYQEIARALGKDGIQALLIEQAIPEIEHETNQILARLTNNQTQIFIESLRDLKKGGSKETLDIKIADPFGLRDYELFSGGEAFRIDFALRIGISKLLARRAGTALQTIFIDEGFGSQDEEGLNLIMDNIYKIQEEFAKIIVVSHLQEMKDQFPVQFIVEKKRSGSTISIVHQG